MYIYYNKFNQNPNLLLQAFAIKNNMRISSITCHWVTSDLDLCL